VTVVAEQEVGVEFRLEPAPTLLDQVVVTTPGGMQTEVRAIPTPVTVITAADIEQQGVRKSDQLFRQVVPSAIAWNFEGSPQTAMSTRGASTLDAGGGAMKVYVDGVEVANRTFAVMDPNSIERIEVVRGPQATTIYGSDAIGGVMQVFTKRGDPTLHRPQFDVKASGGVVQTPYQGTNVARQEYTASVRGGSPTASYNFGASYTRTGDWVPEGGFSIPSVYGGARVVQGSLTLDVSGRSYVQNRHAVLDPRLVQTGFFAVSKPFHRAAKHQEQTYGARISYGATSRWQHNLTVGFDRYAEDVHQTHRRLTMPGDTLLFVSNQNQSKASVLYNTSVIVPLMSSVSATLTGGVDHYTLNSDAYLASGALTTTGTIETAPGLPLSATRDIVNNTGYFVQAQLAVNDALFLTSAVRAERNSTFGRRLGTPLSPRIGLSHVRDFGRTTLKLRGSYGEAIRPPSPGQKAARAFATDVQLANPDLGPERQAGWDAGLDLALGTKASIGVTYYDQTARDLIQLVFLDVSSIPQTEQFQNVGKVKNTGVELESTLRAGTVSLIAQYGYAKSQARELGPKYTGDLRVDEQVFLVPHHTGGASLTFAPFQRTSLAAGLTYVGEWTYYDLAAQFRCFARTGPCGESNRDFLKEYPGFMKGNLSLMHQITPKMSGFVSVENFANNTAAEFWNGVPVAGRATTAGVRLQF
jgi:outer membrane receptor protein involved in Fe transport